MIKHCNSLPRKDVLYPGDRQASNGHGSEVFNPSGLCIVHEVESDGTHHSCPKQVMLCFWKWRSSIKRLWLTWQTKKGRSCKLWFCPIFVYTWLLTVEHHVSLQLLPAKESSWWEAWAQSPGENKRRQLTWSQQLYSMQPCITALLLLVTDLMLCADLGDLKAHTCQACNVWTFCVTLFYLITKAIYLSVNDKFIFFFLLLHSKTIVLYG